MPKIGLEIHTYISTNEKLFCRCKSEHGLKVSKPNMNICPICTGQPGAKPMLPNKSAIDKALQIALILNCKINNTFMWERKHYDWPDLPKGYQNTISGPYAIPVGEKGNFCGINITECHLEEDPAAWNPETGEINYNRSGIPLMEIVTEPEFTSSKQVIEWLKQLVVTLSYIKIVDKKLGIKVDVNISLPELKGERVEIKNINSLKNIKSALEYEIQRQKKPSETPRKQETRMFDSGNGITINMRSKENVQDYRFISDPDLVQIEIDESRIKKIKSNLPETPEEKLKKLIKKYKISNEDAKIIIKKLEIVEFFEKVISETNSKLALYWVTDELLSVLNYHKKELDDSDIDINPEHFIKLLNLIEDKKITKLKAQEILRKFIPKSFSPDNEIKEYTIISNKEVEKFAEEIIKNNKKAVEDYNSGKKESLNFLIGQVMRVSNKRADFNMARSILEKILKKN